MTAPSGKLIWAQAGEYDAVDDRMAITALSNRRTGIVSATSITPIGGGLSFTVGSFLAVVDCGDRSNAVVSNEVARAVVTTAGPESGSRTEILWVGVDPDAGTWTLSLIPEADTTGRLGAALGTITMPAGANTAAQATVAVRPASYDPFSRPVTRLSWTNQANLPASNYSNIGAPSANPYLTAVPGSDNTAFTAQQPLLASFWMSATGGVANATMRAEFGSTAIVVVSNQQGGSVFTAAVAFTVALDTGETVVVRFRNGNSNMLWNMSHSVAVQPLPSVTKR